MDTAQVHNISLQIARNNIALGAEKAKEAEANLYPKLTLNADYKYFTDLPYQLMPLSTFNPLAPEGQFKEAQFGVPHNLNANLLLAVPLYNPQAYGAVDITRSAMDIYEIQFQKTQEQVRFDIAMRYYQAQAVQQQMAFIDSNLVNAQTLLQHLRLLLGQMMAKTSDVDKVLLQISQLQAQRESLAANYLQIERGLKLAMGIPMDRPLYIDSEIHFRRLADHEPGTPLEIHLVEAQRRILTGELGALQHTMHYPSVQLVGSYGTSAMGYHQGPEPFLNWYPVGFAALQVSYPVFNGTVTKRKINQKKLELQANELQLELVAGKHETEVDNATLARDIAMKQVDTALEQIALAKKIYGQALIQHKEGLASLTDILLANNALREAQHHYVQTVIAYYTADLNLMKATGNL
jgi:OMF family outer membrane factor